MTNGRDEHVPTDVEGRITVGLLASWISLAAIPGALGQPTFPESQLPLTISLSIVTAVSFIGLASHLSRDTDRTRRAARIGLLTSQFGVGIAAVGVISFLVFPFDLSQGTSTLGVSLLGLLALAFAFSSRGGATSVGGATIPTAPPNPGRGSPLRLGVDSTPPIFLIVTILLIAGVGFAGFYFLLEQAKEDPQATVILLVAGFVAVTLLLYLGSVAFKWLGLEDRKEALGLPEGSIRALIAMTLILMFAIIGVAVFQSGQTTERFTSTGVPEDQLDQFESSDVLSVVRQPGAGADDDTFDVTVRPRMPEASHDFGLQLLTTVSTLVVAVAGFYFGSRAVTAAAAAVGPDDSAGSIRVVEPDDLTPLDKTGNDWTPADIVLNVSPPFVDVEPAVTGDQGGKVERTGLGRFRYTPKAPGDVVLVTFKMAKPYSGTQVVTFTKPT